METSSQRVAAAFPRMQEREERRSRERGRLLVVSGLKITLGVRPPSVRLAFGG
jgi:hypothetical protein